ncbi:chondroitin AC/alginate lyase [Xylariales sp. PMI_506]|nr:chondroitin AC/alginate lyase [Xylariales sp. PMI_506]
MFFFPLVGSQTQPWCDAYQTFATDSHSSLSYSFTAACPVVTRDKDYSLEVCVDQFASDSVAALQLALMWEITGDESYATKATVILDLWGNTLTVLNGTDGQLAAALSGSNFVNAAEIIRYTYSSSSYTNGWTAASVATFEGMVQNILIAPASLTNTTTAVSYPFEANWGTSGERFMLAAAVFVENATLYDYAKELILYSSCANLSGTISSTGQSSESGRDQQHTQLDLRNLVEAFTVMTNQYDPHDFFAQFDNRLMAGLEYTAHYLMGNSVTYDASFYRCDANLLGGPWSTISTSGLTPIRPIWEAGYAHYVCVKGLSMPYTKALIQANTPDGQSPATAIADGAAFQTLRFRLPGCGL